MPSSLPISAISNETSSKHLSRSFFASIGHKLLAKTTKKDNSSTSAHHRSVSDVSTNSSAVMPMERRILAVPSSPWSLIRPPPPAASSHPSQSASSGTSTSNLMVPSPSSIGGTSATSSSTIKSRIFPSTRFFIALLLCFCYVSIGISTSNISSAIICMTRKEGGSDKEVPSNNGIDSSSANGVKQFGTFGESELMKRRRRRRSEESGLKLEVQMNNSISADQQKHSASLPSSECDHRRSKRESEIHRQSCHEAEKLDWTSTQQGLVFAGQNAGSLLMLFTGRQADRLNSKWTIVGALLLLVISNAAIPFVAPFHFLLAVLARVLTGFSDALLQPSTSSLITRWFPPKERPFAIGLITGGRQIGTILITPLSGWICDRDSEGEGLGWSTIFYLSAIVGLAIMFVWLMLSADKPSKHFCTSIQERYFVEQKIAEEKLGKRTEKRPIPWAQLARCKPFYAGVAALICHEYPLVIMLQLLSKYIDDVYNLKFLANGLLCALPIAILFISKTLSASLASFIQARKKGRFAIGRTPLVKLFNGIASLGLGVCVILVPVMNKAQHNQLALGFICLANAFAGLHTPGVQTALLQIAPAFTGIITGIAFGCVAVASICNKIISSTIIKDRSIQNWAVVFWISGVIALLPVVFFTIWGSADRQPWASTGRKRPSTMCRRGSSRRHSARVYPMDKNGGDGGGTSTTKNNGASDIFIISGVPKRSADEEKVTGEEGICEEDEEEDEEEEEEELSEHYAPEAAVASALRLQMFLEDANQDEREEAEDADGHVHQRASSSHAEGRI